MLDSAGVDDLLRERLGGIDGDRKTDALRLQPGPDETGAKRVDADDASGQVNQRSAGITGIDCRVGLYEVEEERLVRARGAADGAHHADRYRRAAGQAEGVANRDYPTAQLPGLARFPVGQPGDRCL